MLAQRSCRAAGRSKLRSPCRNSSRLKQTEADSEVVQKSNHIFWHPHFIRLDLSQSRSGLKNSSFAILSHGEKFTSRSLKDCTAKRHHRHLARAGECAAGSLPTVPNACKRHFCPTFHRFRTRCRTLQNSKLT